MASTDKQRLAGRLTILAHGPDGTLIDRRVADNMITLGGRRLLAALFLGKLNAAQTFVMAVGTGSEETQAGDTALRRQVGVAPTLISTGEERDGKLIHTVSATLPPPDGDHVLREAGVVARPGWGEGDVFYNRVIFPAITWTAAVPLTLNWDLEF